MPPALAFCMQVLKVKCIDSVSQGHLRSFEHTKLNSLLALMLCSDNVKLFADVLF